MDMSDFHAGKIHSDSHYELLTQYKAERRVSKVILEGR